MKSSKEGLTQAQSQYMSETFHTNFIIKYKKF